MRICASLGKLSDLSEAYDADLIEIRLDILDHVPEIGDKEAIVTFREDFDSSKLPEGYRGIIDIGEAELPETGLRTISSIHDYDKTPSESEISVSLNAMRSDISKGAYSVRDFRDLKNILKASKKVTRNHVILGMGEMGEITRIRQKTLGNLFTFAYVSEPTAPGQLSLKEMGRLDDDSIITGVTGDPLDKSKSPDMHNAAFAKSGISGRYLKFPSPSLDFIGECIRGYDVRGLNVTIPYKELIIPYLDEIDGDAKEAGAVNTIVNNYGVLKGYNTDIDGIERSLELAGCPLKGKNVLIMGSGGASRAGIVAAKRNGSKVSVTGRNEETLSLLSSEFDVKSLKEGSSISEFDIILNATPIGMYGEGTYPADITELRKDQTILDMVYGFDTPLIRNASRAGCRIATGEDMLAMQGARSFELWTGRKEMFETMRSCL